jgi:hypothetical protein
VRTHAGQEGLLCSKRPRGERYVGMALGFREHLFEVEYFFLVSRCLDFMPEQLAKGRV